MMPTTTVTKLRPFPAPSVPTRIAARAAARRLDRQLLAGSDPRSSVLLAARAGTLTSRAHREALAGGLERILAALDAPAPRMRVVPSRGSIRANENELRALAELLRAPAPVHAAGVVFLASLLSDGLGRASRAEPRALARELRAARAALGGAATAHPLPRRNAGARVRGGTPATRLHDSLALQGNRALPARRHEAA
ncbi:MAG TPA: hypothetical protein VHT27_12935 [Solirubrobacteraceae bacterium]|nr:hypothetical protein [Solirubrobacteraceae bacterium]